MTPLDIESIERRERPIIMTAESVRGILEGRKSQTRRVVTSEVTVLLAQPHERRTPSWMDSRGIRFDAALAENQYGSEFLLRCPYGQPGDRLWVREGWRWYGRIRKPGEVEGGFAYRADDAQRRFEDFPDPDAAFDAFRAAAVEERYQWRPSIHMPRWASRLTLEITGIRVERLQEINDEDCLAEGVTRNHPAISAVSRDLGYRNWQQSQFAQRWDSLNAKRGYSWDSNPWVWVIEFKRAEIPAAVSDVGDPGVISGTRKEPK